MNRLGLTADEEQQFKSELAQLNAAYDARREAQIDERLAERKEDGALAGGASFQGPRDRFINDDPFSEHVGFYFTPREMLDQYNQDFANLLNQWGVDPVVEEGNNIFYLDHGWEWANPYGEDAKFNDPVGSSPGGYIQDYRTEGDGFLKNAFKTIIQTAPIVALTGPIGGLLGGGPAANAAAAGLTSAGSQLVANGEIDPLATLLSAGTGAFADYTGATAGGAENFGIPGASYSDILDPSQIQNMATTNFVSGARGTVDFEDVGNGTASDVLENTRWQAVIEGLPPAPPGGWKWEDIKNLPSDALEKIESVIKDGGSLLPSGNVINPTSVLGGVLGTQYPDAPWDWGAVAAGVLDAGGRLSDVLGDLMGGDGTQPPPEDPTQPSSPVTGEPTQPTPPATGEPTQPQPPVTGGPAPGEPTQPTPPATGTPPPGEPAQPQPPAIGEPTPGENPLDDPPTVGPNPAFGEAASIALLTGLLDTPDPRDPLQPQGQYQGPDRSWGVQRPDYGQPTQRPLFNFPDRPNQPIQVAPNPQPLPDYLDPVEAERRRRQQMTGLLG